MRSPISVVDVDRSDTWTRYKKGMCDSCQSNCCTMPVEVRLSDLLRLGLVELYRYDAEEFWFRDGHLLLRGNNGTGKSKVLSLTLPLLLDASLRPARLEPDGDAGKKMAWNLLLGDV